jgi:hypothetical protein
MVGGWFMVSAVGGGGSTWRASASSCFRAISAFTLNRLNSSLMALTLAAAFATHSLDSSGPKLAEGSARGSPESLRTKSAKPTLCVLFFIFYFLFLFSFIF